jgi:hypothetical protein
MVKPFTIEPFSISPFMAKPFLAMVLGAFLIVGATAALADGNKLLDIEPLSSDELSAEKGQGLEGNFQAAADDPLRRRRSTITNATAGGQNAVSINSGQTRQINSTSLGAVNDLVSITNIAGGAGGGG